MFRLDNRSNFAVEDGAHNFNVWKVTDEDGNLVCAFYGPNSLGCAQYIEDALNRAGTLMQPDFSRVFNAE